MTTRDAKTLRWLLNVKNKREASGPKGGPELHSRLLAPEWVLVGGIGGGGRWLCCGCECYCGGVGSAEENAHTFIGRGFVTAGEKRGECGCASGFGDGAEDGPKRFLRLRYFFIADEDHFFHVFLRDGEHKFADSFGCERIGCDSAGRAVHRMACV